MGPDRRCRLDHWLACEKLGAPNPVPRLSAFDNEYSDLLYLCTTNIGGFIVLDIL